ncbi:response regulator [bacterium]|jgi:FixJ family two-component response regulator|nr:response regulator [bacterium]
MGKPSPMIFIVDDDPSVRKGLKRLVKSAGLRAEVSASAEEFLQSEPYDGPCCLILDVCMPGQGGIDLQKELAEKGFLLPVIFITGHGNIPMGVQAMKDGAVDFLPKPFDEEDLLSAIDRAIEKDIRIRKDRSEKKEIQHRIDALTSREYDVLRWVITGMLNKQIASKMAITEKTVKVHRGRVMQKMRVVSVAELVRLAEKAGITPAR